MTGPAAQIPVIQQNPENETESNTDQQVHKKGGIPHGGMPPLRFRRRWISRFEFLNTRLFYAPMWAYMFGLGVWFRGFTLPTLTNPSIDAGGVVGESKARILDMMPEELNQFMPRYTVIERNGESLEDIAADLHTARQQMAETRLEYPLIAKPDIGCRGAGVQKLENEADLNNYLAQFPLDEKIILQETVDWEGEAGVFYIRHPDWDQGEIFSLTLKYFPYVRGDGRRTLRELIEDDPRAGPLSHIYLKRHESRLDWVVPESRDFRIAYAGSHSRGAIFKDGREYITAAMRERFDAISKKIPEFYFGRFDVRFQKIEDLQQGQNFKILEANGGSAEATHIWDSDMSWLRAYKTLMAQYYHMFAIGAKNRRRGYKPMSIKELRSEVRKHQRLMENYPVTH